MGVAGDLAGEPPVEVHHAGAGQGAQLAREAGHGGGEDHGDHQAGQPAGEVPHHVDGEDVVGVVVLLPGHPLDLPDRRGAGRRQLVLGEPIGRQVGWPTLVTGLGESQHRLAAGLPRLREALLDRLQPIGGHRLLEALQLGRVPQQGGFVEVVEDEDQDPGEQDHELHRHLEEGVEEQREPALGEAGPREIPLHLALVGAEVGEHQEQPPQEPPPQRVGPGEAGRRVHHLQPAGALGQGQGVPQPERLGELGDRHPQAEEDADPDDPHLDHVGPDHGAVAAVGDVGDGGPPHQQDRHLLGEAQDHREHQGWGVQRHPHRQAPRGQEQQAGEGAGAGVEAALQVLVGGDDTGAVEEGHQGEAQQDHGEGEAEVDHQEPHPVGVGLPSGAHEGDGADLCRHHRQPHRPPAHPPAGQEEVVDPAVATAGQQAEGHDGHQVDDQHRPVEGGHQKGQRENAATSAITRSAAITTAA